jgi:hypothetical protein
MYDSRMRIQEKDYQAIKRGILELLRMNGVTFNEVSNHISYVEDKDLATTNFLIDIKSGGISHA